MDYIREQFAQRFPAARIIVTFTDDETIVVSVDGLWTMEIASDDDEFVFTRDGDVIRFPFDEGAQARS